MVMVVALLAMVAGSTIAQELITNGTFDDDSGWTIVRHNTPEEFESLVTSEISGGVWTTSCSEDGIGIIAYGCHSGPITLEADAEYIFSMDVTNVDGHDSQFLQAYVSTEKPTLVPGEIYDPYPRLIDMQGGWMAPSVDLDGTHTKTFTAKTTGEYYVTLKSWIRKTDNTNGAGLYKTTFDNISLQATGRSGDEAHVKHAATLTSGDTVMEIDSVGRITSLKTGGLERLASTAPSFAMQVTSSFTKTSTWYEQTTSGTISYAWNYHPGKREIAFTYLNIGPGSMNAELRYWTLADDPGVIFTSLDINSASTRILEAVTFPSIQPVTGDNHLFMPGGDGYVATPHSASGHHERYYPGGASMQFMSLFTPGESGFTLMARDTMAQTKLLRANRTRDFYIMNFEYRLPFVRGESFSSGPCSFQSSGGNWQSAAEIYRTWARKQWWGQPRSADDPSPAWLDEGLLMLHEHARPLPSGYYRVATHDKWGDMLTEWKEATGAGVAAVNIIGYENGGAYTSPYITPFHPSDEGFAFLTQNIADQGHFTFAMLATLNYQIERDPAHGDMDPYFNDRERFNNEKMERTVIDRNGNVIVFGSPDGEWWGERAYVCPGVEENYQHLVDTARALAAAGVDIIEHDQMNGGYSPPCYATDHGHEPGPGFWVRESVANIIDDMRSASRKINPNAGSGLEDPSEVFVPHLDSYLSRVNFAGNWPAQGSGTYLVPAFQYVYGPLLRATCPYGDWTTSYDENLAMHLARVFIAGVSPWSQEAMFSFDGEGNLRENQPWPENVNPKLMQMLSRVMKTQSGPAKDFMMDGDMVNGSHIEISDPAWRYHEDGLDHPLVLSSAWRAPDGRVAFAFINAMQSGDALFEFDFAVDGHAPSPTSVVNIYQNGVYSGTTTVGEISSVEVSKNGVAFYELQPFATSIVALPDGAFEVTFSEPVMNVTADDFKLTGKPMLGKNLLSNGDFETGDLSGWNYPGDASLVETSPYSGRYFIKAKTFGKGIDYKHNRGQLTDALPVELGKKYRFSAWIKTTATGRVSLYHYADSKGVSFYSAQPVSGMMLNRHYGDIEEWTLFEADFRAGSKNFSMWLDSDQDVYLDDIKVREIVSTSDQASISSVKPVDSSTYRVEVDFGRTSGNISLSLKQGSDIKSTLSQGGGFLFNPPADPVGLHNTSSP